MSVSVSARRKGAARLIFQSWVLYRKDGTTQVIKYKYIMYVLWTMFIRPFLANKPTGDVASFCKRWTRGCPQPYAAHMLRMMLERGLALAPAALEQARGIADEVERKKFLRGAHVYIADQVAPTGKDLERFADEARAEWSSLQGVNVSDTSQLATVIVVLGPYAYGKTSTADRIARSLGDVGARINADVLAKYQAAQQQSEQEETEI